MAAAGARFHIYVTQRPIRCASSVEGPYVLLTRPATSWVASLSRASEFGMSLGLRHLSTKWSHRMFVPPRDYSSTVPLWVSEGSPVETAPNFLLVLGNQPLGTLDAFRQVWRPSVRPDHLYQTDRVMVLDPLRLFGHIRHTMQKLPNSVMAKPHWWTTLFKLSC